MGVGEVGLEGMLVVVARGAHHHPFLAEKGSLPYTGHGSLNLELSRKAGV